jgi:hypothetical protein
MWSTPPDQNTTEGNRPGHRNDADPSDHCAPSATTPNTV